MLPLRKAAVAGCRTLRGLFEGPWFAVFMISVLVLWNSMLIMVMLAPSTDGVIGTFSADFKRRCLQYDPVTGSAVWGHAIPYVVTPLVLGVATVIVYWRQLGTVFRKPKAITACVSAALGVVIVAALGLLQVADTAASNENASLAFPAEKLRTELKAPEFRLTNQVGETVSPEDFHGQVVMLTAIYSTCPDSCPMVLAQAEHAIAGLSDSERMNVRVIAVTLDPGRDDEATLATLAEGHQISAPYWNLVTGVPRDVNKVIESMGIWRAWNVEKGRLDHSNAFLLIDRQGRLAYRFSLGETQERWLIQALKLLVSEPGRLP